MSSTSTLPIPVDEPSDEMDHVYALTARYYNAKRALLENELRDLYELKHPKYLAFVRRLEENFIDDCEGIDEESEKEFIKDLYDREQQMAERMLEERLTELMDTMIQECEAQRRRIEHEYHNSDVTSASGNDFLNKKSLRRRPNEPTPFIEKQQHKVRPSIIYKLTEQEIQEDLKLLECVAAVKDD